MRDTVGDCCLHFYDCLCDAFLQDDEYPLVGMELSKVKKCPYVVALAGVVVKIAAIRGAMSGGYIDVLITDYHTARGLIKD